MKIQNELMLVIMYWTFLYTLTSGCHPRGNENSGHNDNSENQDVPENVEFTRRKRQISYSDVDLQQFFAGCIGNSRRSRTLDIGTVVAFTIDHTSWYSRTAGIFCRTDTVSCWQNMLFEFMTTESEFFIPVFNCISSYGTYSLRAPESVPPFRYVPREGGSIPRSSNSINVNEEAVANMLQRQFPNTRTDFPSLIEFFKEDTICSPYVCGCYGVNVPPGEYCGQSWYTRLGGLTRLTSPIRTPLVSITNAAVTSAVLQQQRVQRTRSRSRVSRTIQRLIQYQVIQTIITRPTVTSSTLITQTVSALPTAATTTITTTTITTTTCVEIPDFVDCS